MQRMLTATYINRPEKSTSGGGRSGYHSDNSALCDLAIAIPSATHCQGEGLGP